MKCYVIYSKSQTSQLSEFLASTDGVKYIPVPAFETEMVSFLGKETLFNTVKAKAILRRQVTDKEVAQTLSHIQCWRDILADQSIADNELLLIAEPTIQLVKNYSAALKKHIDSFLQGSHYNIALLQRSDDDEFWNDEIYSGEGDINSIVFNLPYAYNSAQCVMYLIRKSFIRTVLAQLDTEKPYWLSYYFAEFCALENIVQLNKLLAIPFQKELLISLHLNKPLFSIIVPVYNVEKYLSEAIESVLLQDFHQYEIILVNDGSKDESAKICLAYSEKYPHITFVNKSNSGPSATRNLGMNIARGDYLMFLDSDDFWRYNHVLSDLAKIVNGKPVDFVITYISSLIDNTEIIEHIIPSDKLTGGYGNDFYELVENKTFQGYPVIKVVKRELILRNQIYFPEGRFYEDVQWSYFLAKYACSYALYPSPYYMYRREREGSTSEFLSPKKVADMLEVFDVCSQDLQSTLNRDNIYRGLKLFMSDFGDYINLCHSKLFEDQQLSLKEQYEHFTKTLNAFYC